MARSNKKIKCRARNSFMISTISIAMVLLVLGGVGYITYNAVKTANMMRENVTLYVMLHGDAGEQQKASISSKLRESTAIKEIKYVSKKEAAADFKSYIEGDFEEFLAFNPLPDSYEVRLKADHSSREEVKALDEEISSWKGVDEVVYQKNVVERIGSNITTFNIILLLLGGAMLIISFILLNNTLRLMIYSRRYQINIMKIVGASKWFIMRPIVGKSLLGGFCAWLIASAMFIIMIAALGRRFPEVTFLADNCPIFVVLALMLVFGLLISVLFTIFAVNKLVNMSSSKIYRF